jgi:hypothetical protein
MPTRVGAAQHDGDVHLAVKDLGTVVTVALARIASSFDNGRLPRTSRGRAVS